MKWEPSTQELKDFYNSFDKPKERVREFAKKIFNEKRYEEMGGIHDCGMDENCENSFECQMIQLQFENLMEAQSNRMSDRCVKQMKFGDEIAHIKNKMDTEWRHGRDYSNDPGCMAYLCKLEKVSSLLNQAEMLLYTH